VETQKAEKAKHCVVVTRDFVHSFPHLSFWYRPYVTDNDIAFDCISVEDLGNYLHIVAVYQNLPDSNRNLNIWIPTSLVRAVILEGYNKPQAGFVPKRQADNVQDQDDPSS
jgi:hypothetical protein